MTHEPRFFYRPIGTLRSPYARRIDAPHQGTVVEGTETGAPETATLELEAIKWSHDKSKRCGRTAYQFAKNYVGRFLLPA